MLSSCKAIGLLGMLALAAGSPVCFSASDEKSPAGQEPGKTLVLAPEDFERLHTMIKPRKEEWRWTEVPWLATLWEARKKATDEGKPLFVWSMDGEPLGQC